MGTRNLIVTLAVCVVALAVAGEGYFYFYSERQDDSTQQVIQSMKNDLVPQTVSQTLTQAQDNLKIQTEKLDAMEAVFPDSMSIDASLEADVQKASVELAEDDALVADPKLNLSAQTDIAVTGQKADEAFTYFKSLSAGFASTVSINDAAQNFIELVAIYTNEISSYIDALTPGDSNLTAAEIAAYKAEADKIVSQMNSIEDSLNQTDNIPAGSVTDGVSSASDGTSPASSTSNSSDGNSTADGGQGQNSGGGSNGSGNASTTLGDISNQQNVVNQAGDQLNQLDDGSADGGSSPVIYYPSQSGGSNDDNGSNQIQPQPGPIKLIEGENMF